MFRTLALTALAALAVPHVAGAAATCADRTPASITAAAPDSRKCQDAIAKAGAKFLGTQVKTLAKCKAKQPAGTCPLSNDTLKIEKAATGASTSIAKACAVDTVQAGLTSSYAASTDDGVISSCMLSQHNVVGLGVVAESNGVTQEPFPGTNDKTRATCIKELNKQGVKFLQGALKATQKCLSAQSKAGVAGNLSPICIGSFAGGALVAPTDPKTGQALVKLITKTDDSLSKKCGPAGADIASIFACPGSSSVADLQKCIECTGLNGTIDALEQQYAERGSFHASGPGALQAAVSAAAPGDKLLIGSGQYQEEVTITAPNLSIVGCGGATNERPRISPPSPEVTGNALQAISVDGLLFQSLDFFNQDSNHIFVAQANGVTFRDITGDGNRNTRYAVFPVRSNNVLVELCNVVQQNDAPIYVGQSSTIIVRHNQVRFGVAGIEIENSGNAQVYDNYSAGNTAGLLVFKDPTLPVQLAQCHQVHHNLLENNNEPNFGAGTVGGVPTGTGLLVVSADTTPYSYNIIRNNNSAGLSFTTQDFAFGGTPTEQSVDGNFVFNNVITGNGLDPDPVRWQVLGNPLPGVDIAFVVSAQSGNCQSNNEFSTQLGWGDPAGAPPSPFVLPLCTLPPPAVFPGCPAPPIGSPTTTTTSTTTTTTTTMPGSPSPAFVDGPSAR